MAKRKEKQNGNKWSTKHTHETKDRVTRTPLKSGGELRCSGGVGSSCSTGGTRRVTLVTNPIIISLLKTHLIEYQFLFIDVLFVLTFI